MNEAVSESNAVDVVSLIVGSGMSLPEFAEKFGLAEFLVQERPRSSRHGRVMKLDTEALRRSRVKLPAGIDFYEKGVILPPGERSGIKGFFDKDAKSAEEAEEGEEEKSQGKSEDQICMRTRYLMELMGELDEEYELVVGGTERNVVRNPGYHSFICAGLDRLVFVCNDRSNATFVVRPIEEWLRDPRVLMGMSKSKLEGLAGADGVVRAHVSRVRYEQDPEKWKKEVRRNLEEGPEDGNYSGLIAPEGWSYAYEMVTRHGTGRRFMERLIEGLREGNEGDFRNYRRLEMKGLPVPYHISPKVVEMVDKKMAEYLPVPEKGDWEEVEDIRLEVLNKKEELGIELELDFTKLQFKKLVEMWVSDSNKGVFRVGKKMEVPHCSGAGKSELVEGLKSMKNAPEGYKTINTIAKEVGVDFGTVKKMAKSYRAERPQWFEFFYKKKSLRKLEYLAPELCEVLTRRIEEEILKYDVVPESGWVARTDLRRGKGGCRRVDADLAPFVESGKVEKQKFRSRSGAVRWYFSNNAGEILARLDRGDS